MEHLVGFPLHLSEKIAHGFETILRRLGKLVHIEMGTRQSKIDYVFCGGIEAAFVFGHGNLLKWIVSRTSLAESRGYTILFDPVPTMLLIGLALCSKKQRILHLFDWPFRALKKSFTSPLMYSVPGSRPCSTSGCTSYDSCCVSAASSIFVGCRACEPLKGVPKKTKPTMELNMSPHCVSSRREFRKVYRF